MTDIVDRLADPDKIYPEDQDHDFALYANARAEIIRLRDKCDKQAMVLQHAFPERSGVYFICGQGGEVDDNGLPDTVSICPVFGADWSAIYKRISEGSGPEW